MKMSYNDQADPQATTDAIGRAIYARVADQVAETMAPSRGQTRRGAGKADVGAAKPAVD